MTAPKTPGEFDRAYQSMFTAWGDMRFPPEVAALVAGQPKRVLELGCGAGRFAQRLARAGHLVTAVDFSPAAIARARTRVAGDDERPDFRVGDVTDLKDVHGPFDVSFDVGCFHCLEPAQQVRYAAEVTRLLAPGGVHLVWFMARSPSGAWLDPAAVTSTFARGLRWKDQKHSRRRLVSSYWLWLERPTGVISAA